MRYFKINEFDSPDLKGSGNKMDSKILHMLDEARKQYGSAIKINSGYRTRFHNAKVGGVESSSHLKGLAVDIACSKSLDRFKLIRILQKVGFNRIGIGNTFIHVDIDPEKIKNVMWTYKNK